MLTFTTNLLALDFPAIVKESLFETALKFSARRTELQSELYTLEVSYAPDLKC